jgi:CHAT domain-containing protein
VTASAHGCSVKWRNFAVLLIALPWAAPWAHAGSAPTAGACTGLTRAPRLGHWNLDFNAGRTSSATLALPANRWVMLEAVEFGVAATLEATSDPGPTLQADNPVRRTGVLRLLIHTGPNGQVSVTARAKASLVSTSRVEVRAIDTDATDFSAACRTVVGAVSSADAAYAKAQAISTAQAGVAAGSASDLYGTARRNYELAFTRLDPQTELALRAELAHAITAVLYQDLKQEQESAQWSERAAALFQTAGDPYGRARSQALQAAAWMELATLPNASTAAEVTRHDSEALLRHAEDQLTALARFHEGRGELFDAALQRNNIGLARYYGGAYAGALRAYAKALALYGKLGYSPGLAQVTQNIALAEWELGRVTSALGAYQRALHLIAVADSPKLYTDMLNNCGLANRTAGHLDIALAQHTQALELSTRMQSPWQQARSLFGIAMVYSAAGDRSQAADFLREALDLLAHYADARSQVADLRALALIQAQDGNDAESVRLDREALGIATDTATRIRLLVQIADSESRLAQPVAANNDLKLAEQITAGADPVSHAAVDLERGMLEFREGHLDAARRATHAALAADRALGLEAPAFEAIVAAARVEAAAGRSAAELRYLDEGLGLSEAIRVQALDPELRATSMQPLRPAFDLEVDLWVRRYQAALARGDRPGAEHAAQTALEVTERSRARAMKDIALVDYSNAPAAALTPLLARKSELIRDIAAHEYRLEEGSSPPLIAAVRTDISHLREQLALVDSRLAGLGGESTRTDNSAPALRADRLPPDTAVISYWLGEARACAWVVTHAGLRLVDLGSSASLREGARAVHTAFDNLSTLNATDRLRADERLSQIALRPLLAMLPTGVKRLVVIPDGPLHYVPFAVLPMQANVRDSFLIRQFDLAYGSSLGSLLRKGAPAKPTEDRMLLVADAVYGRDDSRLTGRASAPRLAAMQEPPRLRSALAPIALERLPATAAEAAAIVRVAPPVMVDRLEGFAATRGAVLDSPLDRYRYIHFAAHATTDASIPQLSSLILSAFDQQGKPIENRVWAGDLMTRRFNASTVVLSACDTALGANVESEGLLGMRYVVLARGAQSVVASLWAVPDRTTANLMQAFYLELLQNHRRPESALASAMRQSLRDESTDPALWAGFTATIASLD